MKPLCRYCERSLALEQSGYYVMRVAVKPPKSPNRWSKTGFVCLTCHEIRGLPVTIDDWR